MIFITRRDFIQKSTAVAAGCTFPLNAGNKMSSVADKPTIKRYKPFGKTGFKVSDISSGAGQRDPSLVKYIFDCGINYIDTGYQYPGHEETIGKVLPEYREKIFVTTKWEPELVTATVTKEELMKQLDVCLDRLKTTYVDCMMIHAIGHADLGDITRIQNPAIYEAWDEAKKLGKVRFTGASGCGVNSLKEFEWGIDNDRFEVICAGGNFLTHGLEPILKKARAKGIATVAMKTMTVYKSDLNIRALRGKNLNTRQAVIKYVLASDLFDTMIKGMSNYDQIAEYLAVSGQKELTEEDKQLLHTLEMEISPMYCRPSCDKCDNVCPNNVPIANILRYKMYFENYGEEKRAMQHYKKIPEFRSGQVCAYCSAPCEQACPYGIPIQTRLLDAHSQLTFA